MDQERRSLSDGRPVLPSTALRRSAALVSSAALLVACHGLQQPDSSNAPSIPPPAAPAPPVSTAPLAPLPPPPPRENHLSAATRSLVTQAHTLVARGDLDGASSSLDRALRIEPNNPLVWIELGRLRLAENDARQAESCARKALVLSSGDRATSAQAGRVLTDALRAQHRDPEAREVERQPFMR